MNRPFRLSAWLAIALLAGCAGDPGTQAQVTNYEAPGNLESRNNLGCAKPSDLRNTHTPADLYRSNAECVTRKDFASAVYSSALAGVYARYDAMRVADASARQAQTVVQLKYLGSLTQEQKKQFFEALSAVANNPERLAALCKDIRAIGPPNYHPTYMIQHGMGAFLGGAGNNGLVADFDGAAAWEKALDTYLHCPRRQAQ